MGIDWCNKNVASRYPNFHYHHSDVYNKMYNPRGREKSSEYRFIYEDDFFDFVFLTSVFTHMLTPDVNRYLSEISRVMKIGSRCLISCFLINEESQRFIEKGESSQRLVYVLDEHSYTKDQNIPESAVGYEERYFTSICGKNGLKVDGNIHYGGWCGRTEYTSYQDIVIVQKY